MWCIVRLVAESRRRLTDLIEGPVVTFSPGVVIPSSRKASISSHHFLIVVANRVVSGVSAMMHMVRKRVRGRDFVSVVGRSVGMQTMV